MQAGTDQLKLMGPVILSGIINFLDKNSTLESGNLMVPFMVLKFYS